MASILFSEITIAAFAALAIAGIAFAILSPLLSGDRRKDKRLASVTEGRSKKLQVRAAQDTATYRRKAVADSLKEIDERKSKDEKITLRLRLERAGLKITTKTYWILSCVCGAVVGVFIFISLDAGGLRMIAGVIGAFVGVFGLPRWFVAKATKRRQNKFLRELANSMDVIVRGVKSGLPLNECLQIIARESPEPICSEFKEVVEQQRVGIPLGEALDRMANRVPLPEVRFLTIVIGIQQSAGGNLSEALGNLSSVLRDRVKMQMKVQALSSEAKASTMVLGSLPPGVALMLYLVTPDYIMPLFVTSTGNLIVAAGIISMTCGILMMKKMINFKY